MDRTNSIIEIDTVYELFPFLSHFPFDQYIMFYTKEDQNVLSTNITSNIRNYVSPEFINFSYLDKYTDVTVSFYVDDIDYIFESSSKIKKFDDVRRQIETAIKSDNMEEKLNALRIGEKLIKLIDQKIAASVIFNKILEHILNTSNVKISKDLMKKIKTKSRIILEMDLEQKTYDIINIFFNMHLNHIMIIIGIIIAAKLY